MNAGEPPAALFRRLIATQGPISLQQYMGEANARYYAARDPLGSAGDFVTAPEISQMFGELVGLWLADIWQRAGSPSPVHYVELGPGRGTLAKDALRAAGRAGLTPTVHFVEASPALRAVQRAALPHAQWHDDLAMVPDDAPLLIVANEFLDALPVRQLVKTADGWRERMVGIEAERFVPVSGALPMDAAVPAQWREARDGTILETCPGAAATVQEIARRLAVQGGAALLIDYGHTETRTGSTLQAVRAHAKVDPFATPGEADHVRTVRSSDELTRRPPPSVATPVTWCWCPSSRSVSAPVRPSHTRTVRSDEPVTSERPSSEKQTASTPPSCPRRQASSRPSGTDQTRTVRSQEAVARRLPSGENARSSTQNPCPASTARAAGSARATPALARGKRRPRCAARKDDGGQCGSPSPGPPGRCGRAGA